jgi:hypothetical protein
MCRENQYLFKVEQKYQAVYVKTLVYFIAVSDIFLYEDTTVQHSAFMLLMVMWLNSSHRTAHCCISVATLVMCLHHKV